MFLVNLEEVRDRNRHLVGSKNQVDLLELCLTLNTNRLLVVANEVVHGVWDHCECFLLAGVHKLLFLDLNLVRTSWLPVNQLLLLLKRHDELLASVLFLVEDLGLDMRAPVDCHIRQHRVSVELVGLNAPVVQEKQHAVYKDR